MRRRLIGSIAPKPSGGGGGFPPAFSAWSARQEITIPQTASALTDFPVYVDLSGLSATMWAAITSANVATAQGDAYGGDIRITQSDGTTEVPFEPVSVLQATSDGELHFKADTSDAATTKYYIYAGNSGASAYAVDATYGAENVWSANTAFCVHDGGGTDSVAGLAPSANLGSVIAGSSDGGTSYNGTTQAIGYGDVYDDVLAGPDKKWAIAARLKAGALTGSHTIIAKTADGSCSVNQREFIFRINDGKLATLYYGALDVAPPRARLLQSTSEVPNTTSFHNRHQFPIVYN